MNKYIRYFAIAVVLIIIALILWYFITIITYILVAVFLSFVGRPIVDFLKRIKIKKWQFPNWLAAALSLLTLWVLLITVFYVFLPLISSEVKTISEIDPQQIQKGLKEPIEKVESLYIKLTDNADFKLVDYIVTKYKSIIKSLNIQNIFGVFTNTLSGIFIAIFSISFITFFFLKDSNLFLEGLTLFIPSKHHAKVKNVLTSVKKLLIRYFVGIIIQVFLIITLDTLGLMIIGLEFKHAIVIGLFAGIFNIIPYIGPLAGALFGLSVGIALNIHLDFYTQLFPLIGLMILVFTITQIIDNLVFQPLIYSSSVHAHPLEIFLIILIAGSSFGILGMILAIPAYTILRVIGREFFQQYELVAKLTQNLNDRTKNNN